MLPAVAVSQPVVTKFWKESIVDSHLWSEVMDGDCCESELSWIIVALFLQSNTIIHAIY